MSLRHARRTPRLVPLVLLIARSACTLSAQTPADSTIVSGTIRGVDGRVPIRADVELTPLRAANPPVRVRALADGTFRIASAGGGPFRLRAAGVGYLAMQRALPTKRPASLSVSIVLAGFPNGLAKGPLIGVAAERDAEKARPDLPPAVLLAPRGNGRRSGVLRAKRDTVAYRVVDITARLYLAPAGASAYRWGDDGEYDALAFGRAGQDVQLVYDSTGVAFGGQSSLRVLGESAIASVVAQLDSIVSYEPKSRCLLAIQAPPIDPADATLRDTTLSAKLELMRRLLRADAECQTNAALGAAVVALFTPGSPLWQLDDVMGRRVLLQAARQASGQPRVNTPEAVALATARFDASIAAAPDTTTRFDLYVAAAETFMPADTITAQSYAARFVQESYAHPRVLPLLRLTGYNRVLQPGGVVPAFRVASMDNATEFISDVSLRGKVYLLDVWATWCPDCIEELPALRALHSAYGKRGLQLVSVSVDESQGTAERFRRIREPMPWTHGWAGGAPEGTGPLAGLEYTWLPTTILVGKDGRILAFAPKYESPEFITLLERALQ